MATRRTGEKGDRNHIESSAENLKMSFPLLITMKVWNIRIFSLYPMISFSGHLFILVVGVDVFERDGGEVGGELGGQPDADMWAMLDMWLYWLHLMGSGMPPSSWGSAAGPSSSSSSS